MVVIPPHHPQLVHSNTETRSTSKGPSPPLGGVAAGTYTPFKPTISGGASITTSPHVLPFPPSRTCRLRRKVRPSVSASPRPHNGRWLTHRPDFPAPPLACLTSPRNATNSVKKATLVALAAVCNSIASDGALAGPTGCGCVVVLHSLSLPPLGMLTHPGANATTGQGGCSSIQDEHQVSPAEAGAHSRPAPNVPHHRHVCPGK